MSPGELAIRGERIYTEDDVASLHRKIQRLEGDLRLKMDQLEQSEARTTIAQRVLSRLRKQLQPQYESLQALFGELDQAGAVAESVVGTAGQPIPASRYDAWKQRLPPACGKVIDALLTQPLTQSQLETYCKMHFNTVRNSLLTLKSNSIVEKDSDKKWHLKP